MTTTLPMYLYTIRDCKAKAIGPIMQYPNDETAERALIMGIQKDSVMARCPADFELVCIAQINSSTGEIVLDQLRQVCLVSEVVHGVDTDGI